MDTDKKKYRRFQTLAVVILIAAFIVVGTLIIYLTSRNLSDVVTQNATAELQFTAEQQADLINKEINRQFELLDVLAVYFETEDFESEENRHMLSTMARVSRWCTIAYADIDGNAVNYKGEDMGSVADRYYFTAIAHDGQTCAVQYLPVTKFTTEPRFLFSVPVYKNGEVSGVLFASKEVSVLEPILLDNSTNDNSLSIFLVSSDGTILSANNNAHEHISGENFFDEHLNGDSCIDFSPSELADAMANGRSGSYQYMDSAVEYVYYVPVGVNDWYLFALEDRDIAEANYQGTLASIRKNVISIAVAFCALIAFVIILLFHYIKTIRLTEELQRKEKIQVLTNELRDSQIRNSISQMQPHFLYNALGSIREIILEDPKYASDLVYDFTTHLRACVRSMTNKDLIPFEEELENIKAYVNIEKMRFGEKLKIQTDITVSDFDIVPLSIQPLVENAIRHGIYPKGSSGGTVCVSTFRSDGFIHVRVADDGVGFDYEEIKKETEDGLRDSTGLQNTIFRLENLLSATVSIDSSVGKGTVINVDIPEKGEEK